MSEVRPEESRENTSLSRPPVSLLAFRPMAGILLRQFFLYRRSVPRWMEIFYWPLLDLLVWGFLTLYLRQGILPGSGAVQALLGGLLLWDMLYRSQQGISVVFLEEIWSRNLYNLMVAPVTPYHIIFGAMVTGLLKITLSSGTAIFLAYILFSYSLFHLGIALVPFVFCLVVMGWALGIMTTALILRFGQEAEVLAWGVIFLFQPVSAVFNPVSVLPEGFRQIAFFVPASHVFEGMRQVLAGQGFPWGQLLMAMVEDVFYVAGGLLLFSRVLKRAKKVGFSLKLGS
ncbi:MAG: Putative ABC-2 transporter [Leptospirillum sp. Group II 'C75']|jgi:ABC-2 type transport system permease protein|uniref:Transport permease protein n=3 Tax=Leptospirillum ferriphilum TaxID=178606 RepID=A0A059XZI1_9BACT|nr:MULTISPECIES: ABC transporter permease [Leptospirillum]AIA30681.1 ABC transporter [Leptospirillum ferriphilum YSK]EAY55904.1 MAG: putative ABC-2 transporter [Leptospirillum rubarum]EIJ76346.1 MAG: Putative ABC-2 transporter [Leptospirillum sp. Group II 'C75']